MVRSDTAMQGPAMQVRTAMRLLMELGPLRGYYPEPTKSILVCRKGDQATAEMILHEYAFSFVDGHRYVGGFVGTAESQAEWLEPQIQHWVDGIHALAKVARRYPQTAYAAMTKSFQIEWQYQQHVTTTDPSIYDPLRTPSPTSSSQLFWEK